MHNSILLGADPKHSLQSRSVLKTFIRLEFYLMKINRPDGPENGHRACQQRTARARRSRILSRILDETRKTARRRREDSQCFMLCIYSSSLFPSVFVQCGACVKNWMVAYHVRWRWLLTISKRTKRSKTARQTRKNTCRHSRIRVCK